MGQGDGQILAFAGSVAERRRKCELVLESEGEPLARSMDICKTQGMEGVSGFGIFHSFEDSNLEAIT